MTSNNLKFHVEDLYDQKSLDQQNFKQNTSKKKNYTRKNNKSTEIEKMDIFQIVKILYQDKKCNEIIRFFMELLRILLKSLLQTINGGIPKFNTPNYIMLAKIGNILFEKVGLDYLIEQSRNLEKIENNIQFDSNPGKGSILASNSTTLKGDCIFLINLYYSMKYFNPILIAEQNNNKENDKNKSEMLPARLKHLRPIVDFMKHDKKMMLESKKMPFSKQKQQQVIPENIVPIIQGYVENKFIDEIYSIQENLNEKGDLNYAIESLNDIESSRQSLSNYFSIKNPISQLKNELKFVGLKRFLLFFSLIMFLFGFLITIQVIFLPEALFFFISYGLVFCFTGLFSFYLMKKL